MSDKDRLASALLELDAIAHRLRQDCPWDREQNERSIVPHTVEEAYELAESAHQHDDAKMVDELGDVLFQVYFLALLLEERNAGDLAEVARGSTQKLVRRHPHVFGEQPVASLDDLPTDARTPAQVRENWDEIKKRETGGDPLDRVPETLPALLYARKIQKRASVDAGEARAQLSTLVKRAQSAQAEPVHGSPDLYELIGQLLFAAVNLSRALDVDPEIALRHYADSFRESVKANREKTS